MGLAVRERENIERRRKREEREKEFG